MSEPECFQRSLEALAERFPRIHAEVKDAGADVEPIHADGVIVDLKIGEQRLYDGDGRTMADGQVETFLKKPLRFGVSDPRGAGLGSPVGMRMLERLRRELVDMGQPLLDRFPSTGSYFLVVYGVGLGHHLRRLIAETKAKWVFIVEPLPDLLHWSLKAIDWQALFEEAEERGVQIKLSCESDPQRVNTWIMDGIEPIGFGFLDGSFAYIHYPLWALRNARERFIDSVDRRFMARGFYEDELVMSGNAVSNMLDHRAHFVDGQPMLQRPEPVFIVGSGPSVDASIPTIRRWRDRAVVISCGTGLRVLLRQGITPDFHVEIENGAWVPEVLSLAGQYGDLKKITLVTTFTVHPSVPPLFGETFFFFRDSVSSTVMLLRGRREVLGAAPTVANTALTLGSIFGFTEFYLFGIDCGVRDGAANHSRDSVYHDVDAWRDKAKNFKYPTEVLANFGGIAFTDWLLDWSCGMLNQVIRLRDLTAYNCSDGALIEQAIPMVPESVDLADRPCEAGQAKAELRHRLVRIAPGEMTAGVDFASIADEMDNLYRDVCALVDRVVNEGGGFAEIYTEVHAFLARAGNGYRGGCSIPLGSISSITRIGLFYGLRLSDLQQRQRLFEVFIEEYKAICAFMCEETAAMLRGFASRQQGLLGLRAG
jgi:hypothetical protein